MNSDQPSNDPNQTDGGNDNLTQTEQPMVDLVDALQSVDTQSPEASSNATSIEDNNGGRIELNEDPTDPNVIKK